MQETTNKYWLCDNFVKIHNFSESWQTLLYSWIILCELINNYKNNKNWYFMERWRIIEMSFRRWNILASSWVKKEDSLLFVNQLCNIQAKPRLNLKLKSHFHEILRVSSTKVEGLASSKLNDQFHQNWRVWPSTIEE